jgi:hypothetical protein
MIAACGGGDGKDKAADAGPSFDAAETPDGGDVQACPDFSAPAGTIATFPGTFSGTTAGAANDFDVAAGVCDSDGVLFKGGNAGEDTGVQLDGLTAGASYLVSLESPGDLSFFVATGCTDVALTGECLASVDAVEGGTETGEFVAPASGTAFVIVDSFYAAADLEDGTFTLAVAEPECVVDEDCGGATPFCADNVCVACSNSIQCDTPEAPVCDVGTTNTCIAGFDECTGDDAAENADDGPVGATALAPTAAIPAVVNANICSAPAAERDHYSFTVTEGESRVFTASWADDADDIDMVLIDSEGAVIGNAASTANPEVLTATELPAGDYYVAVQKFEGTPNAAAIAYTLTATVPECTTSFDCINPLAPVCDASLSCVAGTEECTGDVDDDLTDNDGPAGATTLVTGVASAAAVCNTPSAERDYFSITLADTADLAVSVAFADAATNDLDLSVFDSEGTLLGLGFYQNPEEVTLSYLPAGQYFIEVLYFGAAVTAALDYTVTATVTDNGDCATATDCAAEFSTQIYRGSCDVGTGACSAIDGAGALADGAACDSPDDCTSDTCSALIFQEAAQTSVCTTTCVDDTDCGTGFSCTTQFQTNVCHPDCTSNLECGANPNSPALDTDQPWDYFTCTAGVCGVDP